MKNLLLLALLLLRPWHAHAQQPAAAIDSLLKVNVEHSGRYTNTFYTMNGEPITSGTLKKLLAKYPESAAELHKYRVRNRNGLLLVPVFLATAIVGGRPAAVRARLQFQQGARAAFYLAGGLIWERCASSNK